MKDADRIWGMGYSIPFFGSAYLINKNTQGKRKIITDFFAYLTLSNLIDESFFNPSEIHVFEFLTAAIVWLFIFYKTDDRISSFFFGASKKVRD